MWRYKSMKKLVASATIVLSLTMFVSQIFASGSNEATSGQKQLKVGVVIPYEIGWFAAFKKGFDVVAKDENVQVVWQYHNYKADQEQTAVQNLITLGVDGINDTAATPQSAEYSCLLANQAKIPIQVTESGVASGKGQPFANIDFDWHHVYAFVAQNLRKDLQGQLSILDIQGFAGSPPVQLGIQGLKEEIAKLSDMKLATDIQYGDYRTDKSLALTKSLVESGLKFNVAIGASQEITEGIIEALKEENVPAGQVTTVSVNGGPTDVANFENGSLDYALSQSPGLHGMVTAYNLISYLRHQTYQKKIYEPIVWVSKKDWKQNLIPWDVDNSWLPVVKEFVKTGKYDAGLRTK